MERVCELREGRLQACPPWSEYSDRGHVTGRCRLASRVVASLTNYEMIASSKKDKTFTAVRLYRTDAYVYMRVGVSRKGAPRKRGSCACIFVTAMYTPRRVCALGG